MPIPRKKIIPFLKCEGFRVLEVDLIGLARSCIGKSTYRRCALMREAPFVVDCASFIKWLYANRGIWLSRDLLLWLELGAAIDIADVKREDLIFTDGYTNRMVNNVGDIGHVGIATEHRTIIHATNRVGVEEISIDFFLTQRKFCCARRIISENADIITLSIPTGLEVETSNDIEWLFFDAMKSFNKIE